jgi:hypothetical protein
MIINLKEKFTAGRTNPLWRGSDHEPWLRESNDAKGKLGTWAVAQYLKHKGFECRNISDEGDLEFRRLKTDQWEKAEVKASIITLTQLKNGHMNEGAWFNQVRMLQLGWAHLFLVGVYPNCLKIWYKSREDYVSARSTMKSTDGLSHIGTDELDSVVLTKNTNRNTFREWEIVYNGNTNK